MNKKNQNQHNINSPFYITEKFTSNIKNILTFSCVLRPLLEKKTEEAIFLQAFLKKKDLKSGKDSLTEAELNKINDFTYEVEKLTKAVPMLRKSSFLILISNLELLIKDVLKSFYYKNIGAVADKENTICIKDLDSISSIAELREEIIEKHVDGIIYESFSNQTAKIFNILGINKGEIKVNLDIINEADKRRNIIIHNDGKVNRRYKKDVSSDKKIGEELHITNEYFTQIYNEIYLFGLVILLNLALSQKDTEGADIIICNDIYEMLRKEKYVFVENFYESCKKLQISDGETELILKINYLLSLKYQGKLEPFEKELLKIKPECLKDKYKAAIFVLKGDKKSFLKIARKSKFTLHNWEEFPLFKEFRTDPSLSEKVKAILKHNKSK